MLTQFDIDRYRMFLVKELTLSYNFSEQATKEIVEKSVINKMLSKSPEFIMHYSIKDNAKEIYDEYCGVPLEV